MMKKLQLLLILLLSLTLQTIFAQTENDPCSAPCLPSSGSVGGATPPADGFSPNVNFPCGGGTSEDNPTWYTFIAGGTSFDLSLAVGGCTNGSSVQVTFFEGDDCGSVSAAGCINCVTAGSISLATVPCKQYWIQVDGCAEAICSFTLTYDPTKLLKDVPPPMLTGPATACLGAEVDFLAALGGCKPSDWIWRTIPAGKGTIVNKDADGNLTIKFTQSGPIQLCVKPKFNVKCPPSNIAEKCITVNVFELKEATCDITLCPEDQPFDYALDPCIKKVNPTIPGTPDPPTFTIDQPAGQIKVYTIPYELTPSGCMGKVKLTAKVLAKPTKVFPPTLICEGDSVQIGGKWLGCADAKSTVQNYVIPFDPSPQKCDTTYNFILQCIKINPIITPANPTLDCINTSVKINAGATVFSPISTAANPGIKSYQWAASNGGVINGSTTNPDITVDKPGTYCVTISYNYTLNTANGAVTKTCQKVRCITVTGSGTTPPAPTPYALNLYPCLGDTASYTVSQNTGTTYEWQITGGTPATFSGPVVKVQWGNTPPFKVCAKAKNVCGDSPFGCIDVTLNEPPIQPVIVGPTPVCQNDSAQYSVTKVTTPGVKYNWSMPPGFIIKGKADTNIVKVMFSPTAATGTITVTVSDKCGTSPAGTLQVVVNELPGKPTGISGKTNVCITDKVTYAISPKVPFATTYKWTIKGGTPTTATGDSVTVTWDKATTASFMNEVCVNASNNCDTIGSNYCITVTVNNIPQPAAGSNKSICGLNVKQSASNPAAGNSGKWTQISGPGTTVIIKDTDAKTEMDASICGEYKYQWTETNPAGCSKSDTVTVFYSVNPSITGVTKSCNPVDKTFTYGFTIAGCTPTFKVTGMGKDVTLNTSPYSFVSGPLPQAGNNVVTYTIQSGSCTSTLIDSVNCNCVTKAGEMDLQPVLTACSEGGKVKAIHKAGTEVNDGNDAFAYLLYEATTPIKAIALNKSGEFSFDAVTMQCDKTYYIGYVGGNDDGTNYPDPDDVCFQFTAQNQEVRWDCKPTPNAGVNQNICGLSAVLDATVPPAGTTGKWKAKTSGTFAAASSPNTTVTIAPPPGTYTFLWVETKGKCKDSASVNVTFKQGNLAATSEIFTCDAQNENYTVKFSVTGGKPPYSILDCTTNTVITTLSAAPFTFTSAAVKNGDPYCFKVKDADDCDTITVQKSYTCGCTSDAKNFTIENVCVGKDLSATLVSADVLDGNDVAEWLLTDISNPKDPAIQIIERNATGKFAFDAAKMQCDKDYFIIHAVGNKQGANVKLDDPCLSYQYKVARFVCVPTPTAGLGAIDTCGFKIGLVGTPATNGVWSGKDDKGNDLDAAVFTPSATNAAAVANVPDFGSYTFKWTATNDICKADASTSASIKSPSDLAYKNTPTCDNTNKSYVLTVDLTGKAPFTLDGATSASGNIVGNQFVSDPITSGKKVTLSFKDIESCKPITYDFEHTCPCTSNGGEMSLAQINKCQGEEIEVSKPAAVTGVFEDGDDTAEFFLHDASGNALSGVIAHNTTGKFNFDPIKMQYDKLYYISYVVGDKKANGEVNLTGLCPTSISKGTPVIWHANPTAIIGTDATICKGSSADIIIDLTGKASFEIFYKEGTSTALPLVAVNNKYVFPRTPTETTVYNFTKVTDANGCATTLNKNITITVNEPPKAGTPTNGGRTCFGIDKTYDLSNEIVGGDAGGIWTVSPVAAGFDANQGRFNVKNTAPGVYTITYTVKGKTPCPDASAKFNITVDPIPVADAGVDKELNCDNREITLGGNSSTGVNIKYNWVALSGQLLNTSILNPTTKGSGKFLLEVSNTETSCFARDTVVVKEDLNVVDSASFAVREPNCFGQDNGSILVDKIYGGTAPYQYSINNGPFIPYKTFANLKSGNYFLKIKDTKGCEWSDSVFVNQPSEIGVDLGDDKDITLGDAADLEAQLISFDQDDLSKIVWYPQCDSCDKNLKLALTVKPQETTLYGITVYNDKGCIAKDNLLVRVEKPRRVYFPSVFTPESEREPNRKFKAFLGTGVLKVHYFKVYDRWGDVVYEELDFTPDQAFKDDKGWDGRYRNQLAQPGVFTYACKIEFIDGYTEIYKGDVLMVLK